MCFFGRVFSLFCFGCFFLGEKEKISFKSFLHLSFDTASP